ncbi:MAG: ribonuclease HII [Oscillatoriales cyanobacterium]|nr:MAG: ribonuclease HII [Oscillatoriales cyanobacterium]
MTKGNRPAKAAAPLVAGVDEVGRGSLFGPVVAAAVILSPEAAAILRDRGVRDSKQLSAAKRQALVEPIQALAIAYGVAEASVEEIDRLNILGATFLAMRRAIALLDPPPDRCLVDGNRPIPDLAYPQDTLVQGDRQSVAIAGASILAKVARDTQIIQLADHYPGYDLAANKGYGTAAHRAALQTLGPTMLHRRSFTPCQLRLDL